MRDLFLADPLLLLLASAALAGFIGLAAEVLVFRLPAFRPVSAAPLRTTYLDAVSTIFALFLAFTAADAWRRNDSARDALVREGQGLRQSLLIARAAGPEAEMVVEALLTYLRVVTEREWRAGKNRAPVAFWSEILSRFQRVREARAARLQIGGAFGDEARWGALLLLGVVSAVAIASTHLDRPAAGRRAVVLFCCMVALATSLVANYEFPYVGYRAVTPEPLEALLAVPSR